jgi:hypothetical protein
MIGFSATLIEAKKSHGLDSPEVAAKLNIAVQDEHASLKVS